MNFVEQILLMTTKKKNLSIFKRHYDKPFTSQEQKIEAQKRNALQYYYRNRLLKLFDNYCVPLNQTLEEYTKVQN